MLKGEKIQLRPVKESDLENFVKWMNDQEVVLHLGRYLPMSELEEKKWIEKASCFDEQVILVIEVIGEEENIPIGSCGLHGIKKRDRDATFGICIGEKQYWKNGYGTEAAKLLFEYAFNQMNLRRIKSCVVAPNLGSQKLHEKIGFKLEGRERESIYINGTYHHLFLYGLLKKEFKI